MNTPIIKIELDGLRTSIASHLQRYNTEYNKMVYDAIEHTLNEEWVRHSVQKAVNQTIQKAIDDLGDNYRLKSAITDTLSVALSQMIEKNKGKE